MAKRYISRAEKLKTSKTTEYIYELRIWAGNKPGKRDKALYLIPFPVANYLTAADSYAFQFALSLWAFLTAKVAIVPQQSEARLPQTVGEEMAQELTSIRDSLTGLVCGQLVRLDRAFIPGKIHSDFGIDPDAGDWDVFCGEQAAQAAEKWLEAS